MTFGNTIASSVVEEKQSRIVEILLASPSARVLMFGKVIACTILAFAQIGLTAIALLAGAAASMVSRTEDLPSTSTPIMMLIFLPYLGVIIFSSNETVMAALSYIPFSAAVAVPMRVFLGTIEWWEPLVSLLILAVTTVLALLLATRIFERSILQSGPKLSWGQALRR